MKEKCGRWNVGEAHESFVGSPIVFLFCINIEELDRRRGIFPGETCEPLVVRGTTSFYNNKLQILPVGEGVVWNV